MYKLFTVEFKKTCSIIMAVYLGLFNIYIYIFIIYYCKGTRITAHIIQLARA